MADQDDLTVHLRERLYGRDGGHLEGARAQVDHVRVYRIAVALDLLWSVLAVWAVPKSKAFANEVACCFLFGRVYHQLRAAHLLAMMGYYTEVPTVLRAAYECGSLARYLAKRPDRAERWVRKNAWIKESEVLKTVKAEHLGEYKGLYRQYSEAAHPLLSSTGPVANVTGDEMKLDLTQPLIPDVLTRAVCNIEAMALWACFALRNSVAGDVLPPEWHRDLASLAEAVLPEKDWSHLSRDWAAEKRRWEKEMRVMRRAAELDDELAEQEARREKAAGELGMDL